MTADVRQPRHGLSKSRITAFEQCPKRLWLMVHCPELAEQDEGAESRFAMGHRIGDIACALHPGGVMVEAKPNLSAAIAMTRQLMADGHPGPIFEATFEHDGVLVRADIISRSPDGGWDLAEVKSSTGAKDYHLGDLATQIWVMEATGLSIVSAAIRHVDTSFVLERAGDYQGLLTDTNREVEARLIAAGRTDLVAEARAVLANDEPPREMGDHCNKPFACEFAGHCGRDLPDGPEWPVTLLPNGMGKKWAAQGIVNLLDADPAKLRPIDARIYAATQTGIAYHDAVGARAAMADWGWPRAWLDFETIGEAVPRWIGTRPYQAVPFQFSLHLEAEDGTITHHEFLWTDGSDPRERCAEALVEMIPAEATIVAYNASFERSVLRNLARDCPDHATALLAMEVRTVDLLPVARSHWYHRDQRGSWSIKAVLPTIAPLDYAGLEVKDGTHAQVAFLEAIEPATTPLRRVAIEAALKAYCERDSWAMIEVARKLARAT